MIFFSFKGTFNHPPLIFRPLPQNQHTSNRWKAGVKHGNRPPIVRRPLFSEPREPGIYSNIFRLCTKHWFAHVRHINFPLSQNVLIDMLLPICIRFCDLSISGPGGSLTGGYKLNPSIRYNLNENGFNDFPIHATLSSKMVFM